MLLPDILVGFACLVIAFLVGGIVWMVVDLILTEMGIRKPWISRPSKSHERYRRRHPNG